MNKQTLEKLCEKYNPNEDHNGAYGHYLAEQIHKQKEAEELEKRADLESVLYFIETVKKYRVNVNNVFVDIPLKEKLLKKVKKYRSLKGDKVYFGNGSDAKIGLAFRNTYYSALKKINEYAGGENKK